MPTCPMCAETVSVNDAVCPHCGHLLRAPAPPPQPIAPPLVVAPTPIPALASLPLAERRVQWVVPAALTVAVALALVVKFAWWDHRRPGTSSTSAPLVAPPTPSPATPSPAPPQPSPMPPAAPEPTTPPAPPPEPLQAPPPAPAPALPAPLQRLVPTSTSASSFLSNGRRQYAPERAFDGDPATTWTERAHGPGDGEWLQAEFASPQRVRRVRVTTGWDHTSARGEDLFSVNSHLRRVRLVLGPSNTVEREVAADQRELVFEGLDVETVTVRIEAVSVWPGSRWADLCISEVVIEGDAAAASSATVQLAWETHPRRTDDPDDDPEQDVAWRTAVALRVSGAVNLRIDLHTEDGRCRPSEETERPPAISALACTVGTEGTVFWVARARPNRLVVYRRENSEMGLPARRRAVATIPLPEGAEVVAPPEQ